MPDNRTVSVDVCIARATLNSFCFDYVTRQKLPGTNLSWYIVEQLPVIAPATTTGSSETQPPAS